MLKKITFFLFCFTATVSFGQTVDLDQKLAAKYSPKEIQALKDNNSEKYDLYMKSFTKGILLVPYNEAQKAKGHTYESLAITSPEGEAFNYLAHNLDLKDDSQYYLINEGKSLLIIKGITTLKQIK